MNSSTNIAGALQASLDSHLEGAQYIAFLERRLAAKTGLSPASTDIYLAAVAAEVARIISEQVTEPEFRAVGLQEMFERSSAQRFGAELCAA